MGFFGNVKRHLSVARAAWRQQKTHPDAGRQRGDETDFLPGALAVLEKPPNPLGRIMAWVIILFAVLAIAWSIWGHVDIVAVAQGRIMPSGRVKVVQPLEIGVVRALHVADGDHVRVGQPLVDLDPTATEADEDRLTEQLLSTWLDLAQYEALVDWQEAEETDPAFVPPEGASREQIELRESWVAQMLDGRRATLAALQFERDRRRAERRVAQEEAAKLRQVLPLITRRAEAQRTLLDEGHAPELAWMTVEQERIETARDLTIQTRHLVELDAAISEVEQRLRETRARFRQETTTGLLEAEQQAAALTQELRKAQRRHQLQQLRAPIAGVVQNLAIHTVGGVVTPAQELMRIVPEGGGLEVEAWLANKDIGFVEEGQEVEIKLETFPFTKYGLIAGVVDSLSPDAIQHETLGLVYTARIRMLRTRMAVGDRMVNLAPGMSVTAEIKTGQRRLIEFFLSTVQEHVQEGLRER